MMLKIRDLGVDILDLRTPAVWNEFTDVKELCSVNNNTTNDESQTEPKDCRIREEDLKRKIIKNYRFLKSEIDGKYLVDTFLQEDKITSDEHEDVQAISTRLRRTETFLNILLSKPTTSKAFSLFYSSLESENYQKACSILNETVLDNNERKTVSYWDTLVSAKVEEHYSQLASEINGLAVAEILFENEILPFEEFEKIVKTQSTAKKRKTEEFLNILKHQHIPGIYAGLRPILEETDEELLKLFEETEEEDETLPKQRNIHRKSQESEAGVSVRKCRKRKSDDDDDKEQPLAKRSNVWTYDNISVTTTVSDGILNWSIPLDQLEDLKPGVRLTFNIEKNDKEETEAKMLKIIEENNLGQRLADQLHNEEIATSHQSNQKGSIVIRLNIDSENTIRRLRLAMKQGTMQKVLNVLFQDENIKDLFQGSEFKISLSIDTDVTDCRELSSLSDREKKELKTEQCRILKNYTFLLEETDAKNFKNTFVKEKLFTSEEFDKILDMKNSTREQRTSRFLRQLLQSRNPKLYDVFYNALEVCRLHDVAQTLLETAGDHQDKEGGELLITPKGGETSNLIMLQLGLRKTQVSTTEEKENEKVDEEGAKSPVPRKREHESGNKPDEVSDPEKIPPTKERRKEATDK